MAINEKALTKGQLRKLKALRKSLGTKIADRAYGLEDAPIQAHTPPKHQPKMANDYYCEWLWLLLRMIMIIIASDYYYRRWNLHLSAAKHCNEVF